jgi:hypothetical protein
MLLCALTALAFAGGDGRPATLAAGLGAAAGPAMASGTSVGGYGVARVVLWPQHTHLGIEFGGAEGYAANDGRTLGHITIGARWAGDRPPYVRAGLVHHHETPIDVALDNPFGAMLGSAVGIRHRTGIEAAFGVDVPIVQDYLDQRVGLELELSVSAFPDTQGPPIYAILEQTWSFDVGKRR